jgi:hypothetical protein
MTEKAEAVLRKIRQRQAHRRDRILDEFNQSTLDDVGPLGGDQGMKLLSQTNSMVDEHDKFVNSLMRTIDVL